MKNFLYLFLFFIFIYQPAVSQDNRFDVVCIGFYNVENLFDTIDDPKKDDAEFLPGSVKSYTNEVYRDKLKNLAEVISQLGKETSPDGIVMLGVAEIENAKVLEDLSHQPKLKDRKYKVVHYDSPDTRGIDVALLYNPSYFTVKESAALKVRLKSKDGRSYATRDILWVYGFLGEEPMHVLVNHWPSRRSGEKASAPSRATAAGVAKAKIDSINKVYPNAKIILMGDLNDDPVSPSIVNVLKATGETKKTNQLYNPWTAYYNKGQGTLTYNNAWNLFDQVIVSSTFLDKKQEGYFYDSAVIFNKPFLLRQSGRNKGFPLRTYESDVYIGGYSDHLPVYIFLKKKVNATRLPER